MKNQTSSRKFILVSKISIEIALFKVSNCLLNLYLNKFCMCVFAAGGLKGAMIRIMTKGSDMDEWWWDYIVHWLTFNFPWTPDMVHCEWMPPPKSPIKILANGSEEIEIHPLFGNIIAHLFTSSRLYLVQSSQLFENIWNNPVIS